MFALSATATASGCVPAGYQSARIAVQPELLRAKALLSIGCYACLIEAFEIYQRAYSDAPDCVELAENAHVAAMLMAFRERELGLPESSARDWATARTVASPLPLDVFELVLRALSEQHDSRYADSTTVTDATQALTQLLTIESRRNLAAAYALTTLACQAAAPLAASPSYTQWLSQMRDENVALRYAELRCVTSVSTNTIDAFLQADPRFAEIHYAAGVDALQRGRLLSAYEHLKTASHAFTRSHVVALALADVSLALARFDEALHFYETAIHLGGSSAALLGRAKSLTYLGHHREAISVLSGLLESSEWSPGEKYYWRAWNLYSLSEFGSAHRDVLRAMDSWSAPHVQRLAGLTAFALGRPEEARSHLLAALALSADDCESRLYLAQLASSDGRWHETLDGLNTAATCFAKAITELEGRKPDGAADVVRAGEISRLQRWRASALYGAAISAKILGRRELALDYARRLLDGPELQDLAREFIFDIDVPASPDPPDLMGFAPSRPRPDS